MPFEKSESFSKTMADLLMMECVVEGGVEKKPFSFLAKVSPHPITPSLPALAAALLSLQPGKSGWSRVGAG